MTEDGDEYFVAELVERQLGDVSELSEEKMEQVAELQRHYREIDVDDYIAETPEELGEKEKRAFRLILAELKRLGSKKSPDELRAELEEMGVDKEKIAERFDDVQN